MKILFATTNPAKVKKYKDRLEKRGIELLTIKDLDIKLDIDENGKDCLENAFIKAKAYYEATGITSIGMDNNLFVDELPEDKQPGTHVRRINGKELNDEEMIKYYTNLVKEYGGKLNAKWVYGMVIYDDEGKREYTWTKGNFYLVDTPSKIINAGYPLDSISIIPEFNKYLSELTDEEKNSNKRTDSDEDNKVVDYIEKSVKGKE